MGCESDDPQLHKSEPYGGLVEFVAKVQIDSNTKEIKIVLLAPQRCPSTRFSRRFGSKRFFRLRISRNLISSPQGKLIASLIRRPFVVMGKVFRAFTAKDSSVFFVQTFEEEHYGLVKPRTGKPKASDPMPFLDFIRWHNPLEDNHDQVMIQLFSDSQY